MPATFDGSAATSGGRPETGACGGAPSRYARRQPIDAMFGPSSVAVIGASEKPSSVGRTILWNLVSSPFGGSVFPVNPARSNVLGIRAYPALAALPEVPELAVIVTPAPTVPAIVSECGERGVRAALILSAGFRETGPDGAALEQRVLDVARPFGLRLLGPNSLGLMSPASGLNASMAQGMAQPGSVAFLSESGALCAAILDWSFREHVGFSAFVSVGSMVDVGWGDLIDHLGHDPHTRSIVIYMESIGNARAFLSAAREAALAKPIIVMKSGRSQPAARAAACHTGALTGSDEVLDAAFRRCGVLRVDHLADLFYMAEVLSKQPRPRGPRLTIVTNAGGPGVLAADSLIQNGGQLAEVSEPTLAQLNALLPDHWSRNNPVDMLGDAGPERYARALEIASSDPQTDGLLVVLAPQAATEPTTTAEAVAPLAKAAHKPVLASWMGGAAVAEGERLLNAAGIPTFPYPDTAARMFTYMWRYSSSLTALYETPVLPAGLDEIEAAARGRASALLDAVRRSGRTLLTEVESKALLAAYDIPMVDTRLAASEDEAAEHAEAIGYPVVLKLHSATLTHKADAGGVRLGLDSAGAVREAFRGIRRHVEQAVGDGHFLGVTVQPMVRVDGVELIIGSSVDPQFGPVLLFGSGGRLTEVTRDQALALPPLNTTLARRLMERTRISRALNGRGGRRAVDEESLAELLVRFSHLVCEQRWIAEVDINPLIASSEVLLALDARVVVHPPDTRAENLPALAIRPYPTRYVGTFRLRGGREVTIRPIRPEDEPLMAQFHETLSDRSVYLRFFHLIKLGQRISHERLARVCFIDYDRDMALVAEGRNERGEAVLLAVGRLTVQRGTKTAEFAILVSDDQQGQGLGTELLGRLVQFGRDQGVERIVADILPENQDMQQVSEKVGFTCRYETDDQIVRAEMRL